MTSPLTSAQLTAFRTAINADVNIAAQRAAGAHGAIAAYYAGAATGTVWRPSISTAELNTAIVWSEYAALTAAQQNTYLAMIAPGYIDATSANVRAGFATVFVGKVSLTNLTTLAQRVPSKFESIFTNAQVCSLFGYTPTVEDVAAALGS